MSNAQKKKKGEKKEGERERERWKCALFLLFIYPLPNLIIHIIVNRMKLIRIVNILMIFAI